VLGHSKIGTANHTKYGDFIVFKEDNIIGKSEATDYFYTFWMSLEHPSRKDIKPAEIKKYLEHIVMLDVQKSDQEFALHVRLIGTFVADFYGEISDQDVRAMPNKQAADRIYRISKMILDHKAPLLSITPALSEDKRHLEALALYMPLFDDAGAIEKIMVCVDVAPKHT